MTLRRTFASTLQAGATATTADPDKATIQVLTRWADEASPFFRGEIVTQAHLSAPPLDRDSCG